MAPSYIGILLLGVTSVVATLCGDIQLPPGQFIGGIFNVSIRSDGIDRSFLISIPPEYHSHIPNPVIVSYHGGDRTAESQLQLDQLTNPEFNTRDIVVYPQGIDVKETPLRIDSLTIKVILSNLCGHRINGKASRASQPMMSSLQETSWTT